MIIRDRPDDFVMIEQVNHAKASGDIMVNWKDSLFEGSELRKSVDYAIYHHDLGWQPFDKQPFWNDQSRAPFTFVDFPSLPKIMLYTYGIDEVEKVDHYAALLCSEHYKRFLLNDTSPEAQAFIKQEETRQTRIFESLNDLNKRLFKSHYALVQLGDNLSLYSCLNEPGIEKKNEHPFFRKGIPLSSELYGFSQDKLQLHWKDASTIAINEFPFKHTFNIVLKQKTVAKNSINTEGLIKSYENTPFEEVTIRLVPKK